MAEYYARKCPICGKSFMTIPEIGWAFKEIEKTGRKYFCSWTCIRQYEKEKERKSCEKKERAYEKKRTRFFRNEETGEILSAPDLAKRNGILYTSLAKYYAKGWSYRGWVKYEGSAENEK